MLLQDDIAAIRSHAPLVHNITNFVVMNNTANALLSLGASPVMAHAAEEVEDMVSIASALVVNVGTLSPSWVEAMELAMRRAASLGVPIVYDPVGAGATPYRNSVNVRLLSAATPTIIRGNGSEIMALAADLAPALSECETIAAQTKGVDSTASSDAALEAAKRLSSALGSVVVISGPRDYIVSGSSVQTNDHGTPMMARVTGMGCTSSALCGAFVAVRRNDPATAALHAMQTMGMAGEKALAQALGPGSFQVAFLDALYNIKD